MKKILFLIILMHCFIANASALSYGGCDYSVISRLKSLVTNVNTTYDYRNENGIIYFDLTITNITPEMYFYNNYTRKNYTYSDTNNGEITIYGLMNSGTLKFYSNVSECNGINLGTKYYKFPTYNQYHTSELCKDIQNYSLCQKWADVNYSRSEFQEKVEEYKKSKENIEEEIEVQYSKSLLDIILEFYINYYYIVLGLIILVCGTIIIVKSRNNKFDL